MDTSAQALRSWLESQGYAATTVTDTIRALALAERQLEEGADLSAHMRPHLLRWRVARAAGVVPPHAGLERAADRLLEQKDQPRLRIGKARAKRAARSLDDEAWIRLVEAIRDDPSPQARVLEVMAATGLRVGDVLRIPLPALREALSTPAKRLDIVLKGQRVAPQDLEGAEASWRLLAALPGDGSVALAVAPQADPEHASVASIGGGYKAVSRALRRLCVQAQVNEQVWTHRIRRTVGVQAYRLTEDLLAVRDLLQHRTVRTTEGYLSEARPERVADLQRKLHERFAPPSGTRDDDDYAKLAATLAKARAKSGRSA